MGNWVSSRKSTPSMFKKASSAEHHQALLPNDHHRNHPRPPPNMRHDVYWWLSVSVNIILLLAGQIAATLLNRYYYDQGGNSKWIETLTFSAAFPILYIPLLFFPTSSSSSQSSYKPSLAMITLAYVVIGLISVCDCIMFSYGLLYLSVSTYSLLCASQLGFNAVFSYFINKEKFTHFSLNSFVLLTYSAAVIGIRHDSDSDSVDPSKEFIASHPSGRRVPLGFILTLVASAAGSFALSLIELTFDKLIKTLNFSAVLNMQIYTSFIATLVAIIGLFASGEWRTLTAEIEGFKRGRVGWEMTVIWSAIAWQVTNVGLVGLIFTVSSLFSNFISTLGIPIVPLFAMVLFGDRMDGMKVISLLLALWGFVSYFYQYYIDDKNEKKEIMMEEEIEADYA